MRFKLDQSRHRFAGFGAVHRGSLGFSLPEWLPVR
jgi:hypothetical protein